MQFLANAPLHSQKGGSNCQLSESAFAILAICYYKAIERCMKIPVADEALGKLSGRNGRTTCVGK